MTFQISVKSDIERQTKNLLIKYQEKVRFATSKALNRTSKRVVKLLPAHLAHETATPVNFTLRGFKYKPAGPRRLVAVIYIKRIQWSYLKYLVARSTRYPKKKSIAVPNKKNVKLNKFGNVPGKKNGLLKKNMFIGKVQLKDGSKLTGIWKAPKGPKKKPRVQRKRVTRAKPRGKLKLMFVFQDKAKYKKTFRYYDHVQRIVEVGFAKDFKREMDYQIRTFRG